MKITDITIGPFDPDGPYYVLTNAVGVTYRANRLDALIREFVKHSQQPAVSIVQVSFSEPK